MDRQLDLATREEISAAFEAAGVQQRNADVLAEFALNLPADVKFIENKPVDFAYVEQVLEPAFKSNHFTNFGPVTSQFENVLHTLWGLSDDRVVVSASSATTALCALVGVHSNRLGRPLRIAASSFGFMSTNVGPLADTILIDCDDTAMLDLGAVDEMLLEQIDALLVTNIFGNFRSFEKYRAFCDAHDKILLIDNATGFCGVDRSENFDEIVSFHHTKPWGLGEGGVAVLDRADAKLFRSLMNFGVGAPDWLRPYASNSKVSDFSAALYLERLERLPEWARAYRAQKERIANIARICDYRPFLDGHRDQIHAHLPLEATETVSQDRLAGSKLPFRKYYRPLTDKTPRAVEIYARNVCIPAHLGLNVLSDSDIEKALKDIK